MFLLWIVFTVLSPIINTDFFVSFDRLFCRLILLPMSLLLTLCFACFCCCCGRCCFCCVCGCWGWGIFWILSLKSTDELWTASSEVQICCRLEKRRRCMESWFNVSLILSILKNSFNGNTALFLRFLKT